MWILVVALVFGAIGASMAGGKGRSQLAWFVICFLFPLIGIIFLAISSNLNEESKQAILESTKICPECAERIQAQAKICRFCQHKFEMSDIPTQKESIVGQDRQNLMKQYDIKWSVFKSKFIYKSNAFSTFEEAYDFAKQDSE